ncbi:MAG: hypothetical protein IID41_02130 [Planctomycetes bacterium]|nr:hypothetical protein [Planctomycetota bacterium]
MLRNAVFSLAVLVALPAAAHALPPDQIVTYSFREVPSDPLSDVLITMELHIAAQSQSGDDVTWKITELHFVETASGDSWTESARDVGDWVVTHADPAKLTATDFTDPPTLSGSTSPDQVGNADLDYKLAPGTCDATCQSLYGGSVIGVVYKLAEGTRIIAEEVEEEPTEVETVDDPS